jgi:hypothetical protein
MIFKIKIFPEKCNLTHNVRKTNRNEGLTAIAISHQFVFPRKLFIFFYDEYFET